MLTVGGDEQVMKCALQIICAHATLRKLDDNKVADSEDIQVCFSHCGFCTVLNSINVEV